MIFFCLGLNNKWYVASRTYSHPQKKEESFSGREDLVTRMSSLEWSHWCPPMRMGPYDRDTLSFRDNCSQWGSCRRSKKSCPYTGCPKKTHFQIAAGVTVNWLNHHLPAPPVSGDWFFGRFLVRLRRIKRPQVMSMVKFSPIALNFGYDFNVLVHFLYSI